MVGELGEASVEVGAWADCSFLPLWTDGLARASSFVDSTQSSFEEELVLLLECVMGTGSFMTVKKSMRKRRKLSAHHVEVIELVMSRFDFEFVLKVKKLVWKNSKSGLLRGWRDLTVEDLKKDARKLLTDLLLDPKKSGLGCGGLWAERWYAHSHDGVELSFVVEDVWAPMRGELTNVHRLVYSKRYS